MKLKLLVFWSQSPGDTEEGQETSKWKSEPSDDGRGKNWLTWWGPSKRTSSSKRCDALVKEKRWHFPQTIKRGHSVSRCNREYPTEDKLRSPLYELVVRNPIKGSSPVPVATYVTCDHTTASVLYFLSAFQTDHQTVQEHTSSNDCMWWLYGPHASHITSFLPNQPQRLAPPVLQHTNRKRHYRRLESPYSPPLPEPCNEKCKDIDQK